MVLEISNDVLRRANISEADIMLHVAIQLFKEESVTLAQASEIAGLHQIQFQKELAKRRIPLHYGIEELEQDLKTLATLD